MSLGHNELTHWGRMTHICVSYLAIIGSDNSLSPGRRQAIIRINDGILLIEPLGTNFSEILIKIYTFSFKKMHLKSRLRNNCKFVPASMCQDNNTTDHTKPMLTLIPDRWNKVPSIDITPIKVAWQSCGLFLGFLWSQSWLGSTGTENIIHAEQVTLHNLNTLRPRLNGCHFPDNIFKCFLLNENVWIPIKILLKFVPKGPINNTPVLVQIMAWCLSGAEPLSELVKVSFPTRPQWVKESADVTPNGARPTAHTVLTTKTSFLHTVSLVMNDFTNIFADHTGN